MASNKSYTIKLGVGYDAEILGKLETEKNKSAYMKDLIRKDIAGELDKSAEFKIENAEKTAKQYSRIIEEKYKEQFYNNSEIVISFSAHSIKDEDIVDKLNFVENKSDYIKQLILMDMGLIDMAGKRFLLLDENGNAKKVKRTISEKRKEAQREYSKRVGYDAQKKYEYDKNYLKKNYSQISIKIPIEFRNKVDEHIKKIGEPITQFIKRAIEETIERDCNK